MSLNTISGQFRSTILNLNLQTPPDIVTGLVDLTNSVTVSAYLGSLGQDAAVHFYNVQNPGDVDTDGIPARIANLNKTLNTPVDLEYFDPLISHSSIVNVEVNDKKLTLVQQFNSTSDYVEQAPFILFIDGYVISVNGSKVVTFADGAYNPL